MITIDGKTFEVSGDEILSLRDFFAAFCAAGQLANEDLSYEIAASQAYQYADAMLKARKQCDQSA